MKNLKKMVSDSPTSWVRAETPTVITTSNYYVTLIEQMRDIVFELDTHGRWVFLNSAWQRATNYSVPESLSRKISDFQSPPATFTLDALKPLLEGRTPTFQIEFAILTQTEKTVWFECNARRKEDDHGVVTGIVGTLQDITQRKLIEEQLISAKENALSSARAKTAFLANMSHEIRTPMNGIVAMTTLLTETNLSAQQMEYVSTIKTSADALLELINDILDFSKIEAGKLDLENVPFDVISLVSQVEQSLRFAADRNGTVVSLDISSEIPGLVLGDPHRLRQILTNLLGNAIKFTAKGTVVVRARSIYSDENKVVLEFAVKDSGVGIAKENLNRIFDVFSQGDNSTTRKFGGTGLGLSITERLVRLMGGKISVQSELGIGSEFSVQVKFDSVSSDQSRNTDKLAAKESAITKNQKQSTTSGRLLIAEDNVINQKVFLGLLKGTNYQIDIVDNGLKAVEALKTKKYDVVLMDCQMPEMDGYEATQKLRAQNPPVTVPIIAVTANAMKTEKERCFAVGMNDYVSKPISGAVLIETIEKWLSSSYLDTTAGTTKVNSIKFSVEGRVIEQLRRLGQENQSQILTVIVELFLSEAPSHLKLMETDLLEKNFADLKKKAHYFKSSCNGVGVGEMTAICERIEKACCATAEANLVREMLEELWHGYRSIKPELESILSQEKSA